MKEYIAISVVGGVKFYLNNNGDFEETKKNAKILKESEIGRYFDKIKRCCVLKTKIGQIKVEER